MTENLERRADEIEAAISVIAGHLNAQHAELVDHTAALLADRRLWQGAGVWSTQHWLAWRTGVSTSTARNILTIAERLDDLPECVATFRRGELSLEQMAAIAKRAPSWTDTQIAGLGAKSTVRQIQRLLATYPFPDEPSAESAVDDTDATDEQAASAEEAADGENADEPPSENGRGGRSRSMTDKYCSMGWDDDGRFHMSVHADADVGLIIEAAMREARDHLFKDRGLDSRDGHGHSRSDVTWLDALREIAERSLDSVADPARRRRFIISVFVDTDGTMTTASKTPVADEIRERLTCDRSVTPILLENGLPLSVGRTQRIVPDRTRRIVERRDHHRCRVPGCGARHFLEVHHVVHWLQGGPTDTWNLMCLCPHHHRLHHRGGLGISGDADLPGDVVFTGEHGRSIAPCAASPIPPAGPPPPPLGRYQHPLGERLDTRWFEFREPAGLRQTAS